MALVKSNRKNNRIDRGKPIKPKNEVTLKDIQNIEGPNPNTSSTQDLKKTTTVTKYANVRVDNHIRNKLEALISLGIGNSQKQIVNDAVNFLVDNLSKDDQRLFKTVFDTLEAKDVRQATAKR